MRDINNILPKLPKNSWGALTNYLPGPTHVNEMRQILPYDSKWHTIFREADQTHIDGKRIWHKKPEQLT